MGIYLIYNYQCRYRMMYGGYMWFYYILHHYIIYITLYN